MRQSVPITTKIKMILHTGVMLYASCALNLSVVRPAQAEEKPEQRVEAKYYFSLAPQGIDSALIEVANQLKLQLVMEGGRYARHQIDVIEGHYTSEEILQKILQGSGYRFRILKQSTLIVTPENDKTTARNDLRLEELIVTGTGNYNTSKLDSAISITSVNRHTLAQESIVGLAGTLQLIPGIWVEDSGGEANNNVSPRGLRGGDGFRSIGVQEDGLPVVYDGVWVDYFYREDLSLEKIEAVRGGTSGIFTVNGPAALINYISRTPEDEFSGDIRIRLATYNYQRLDAFLTGPVNTSLLNGWNYSLSTFYRLSDGIRETGFTADKGGQVNLKLMREFDSSAITLSARYLNDITSFYTPIPLTNPNNPTSVASFDANYDTLLSQDLEHLHFLSSDGEYRERSLQEGTRTKFGSVAAFIQTSLNDQVTLSNHYRYSNLYNRLYTTALNGGNETIMEAEERLHQSDVLAMLTEYSDLGATRAEYRYASSGERVVNPAKINGNGLVTESHTLYSKYQQQQHINDFRIIFDSSPLHITGGVLYVENQYDDLPLDQWEGRLLIDVQNNPNRLDIVAVDDAGNKVGSLTDNGFLSYTGFSNSTGKGQSRSISTYLSTEYQLNDRWRIDMGLRYEYLTLTSDAETDSLITVANAYDENGNDRDTVLANNQVLEGSGFFFHRKNSYDDVSATLGMNYRVSDSFSFFSRYADSFEMPRLMDFGRTISGADYVDTVPENISFGEVVDFRFAELGGRYNINGFGLSTILFHTYYSSQQFSLYENTRREVEMDTEAKGVELEATWRPKPSISFDLIGVWQDAIFSGISSDAPESVFNGNTITRTPKFQLRLAPRVHFNDGSIYFNFHYVGTRYSDIANEFKLPDYHTLDLGMDLHLTGKTTLTLKGNNIFNTVGLTEGNHRSSGAETERDVYYARPIYGRYFSATLQVSF
ncbi:TonB-dependent receptor [Teredinibacter sp. KSP-S5-2]|uniref:TonB-dependent receptor n=1 Tax=Teredinibacter sp. KSP-S5-2 TaxID=3034506 RepID=UPI002934B4B7|nr:TonB-dependent receptor [Teredinibacter sp. KSP-S5-2]WNO08673.1 TonB-dependent receptor [Teredinibacter sp. KSP-S5-2]